MIMKLIHSAVSTCWCLALSVFGEHLATNVVNDGSNKSRLWELSFPQNRGKPVIVFSLSYLLMECKKSSLVENWQS